MKDSADSNDAPYHSCNKRKQNYIEQGIAAPHKWDVAVPCCLLVDKGDCSKRRGLSCKIYL